MPLRFCWSQTALISEETREVPAAPPPFPSNSSQQKTVLHKQVHTEQNHGVDLISLTGNP